MGLVNLHLIYFWTWWIFKIESRWILNDWAFYCFIIFVSFKVNLDLEKRNQLVESSPNFIFAAVNLDPIVIVKRWKDGESWPNKWFSLKGQQRWRLEVGRFKMPFDGWISFCSFVGFFFQTSDIKENRFCRIKARGALNDLLLWFVITIKRMLPNYYTTLSISDFVIQYRISTCPWMLFELLSQSGTRESSVRLFRFDQIIYVNRTKIRFIFAKFHLHQSVTKCDCCFSNVKDSLKDAYLYMYKSL